MSAGSLVYPDKHLCKRCIKGYADAYNSPIDKYDIARMTFTVLTKCDDCMANTYCKFVREAHYPSTGGGSAESDEVTKIATVDLTFKEKPVATNKRDARKRHMKHNNKPKGNSNQHIRKKT